MLTLAANLNAMGSHLGEWRHPLFWKSPCMNLQNAISYAQLAERGKFDFVFLADGNGVRQMDKPALFAASAPATRPAVFEPITLLSAIATHTSRIGLIATATTTFEEPFTLARKFASLDHISKGRAGWNLVTTGDANDAPNFGHDEHMPREARYARAREYADVVRGLWDSWSDDAFTQDAASGRYLDPTKVHRVNYKGEYLSVRGPLNIARPPQGYPVIVSAGQSEDGRELSAAVADCIFVSTGEKDEASKLYADFKARMIKYGRGADEMKILPGLTVIVEEEPGEADRLLRELEDLVPEVVGVDYLSRQLGQSLDGCDLDGPLPPLEEQKVGGSSIRFAVHAMAMREGMTIRQAYKRAISNLSGLVFKGRPAEIADQMEEWYVDKACDGFVITAPVIPTGMEKLVRMLIPELQRRQLFRRDYEHQMLRQNLGLARPGNQFFA